MTTPAIQQHLSTPEGFAKSVAARRPIQGAALACLALGIGGIAMNLFQLGSASDWDWSLMMRFFWDAQAIEFTGSRSGRAEAWRYAYVYGPIVLLPLGLILLGIHLATRSKSAAGLYEAYRERGWVGRQWAVGLTVPNGNAKVAIAFVSHPSVPDAAFEAAGHRYAAYLDSLDKKARKAATTAAVKAGVLTGVSAAALLPDLDPAILAAPLQPKGDFVVVVPPAAGGKGATQVLPIRE
ncbi:hypothetical protein EDD28_2778 [Salana multivorans]|uniref:Uncharacterized protein n=1 Tax=Salana multivorans TaxID=120377 RepID=A0A3N2D0S4_9MICO|nr:hypothetical protein [Salana multivorans]ROR93366.1 hypothetical protein EDD28_2778 [Salana multivorans]